MVHIGLRSKTSTGSASKPINNVAKEPERSVDIGTKLACQWRDWEYCMPLCLYASYSMGLFFSGGKMCLVDGQLFFFINILPSGGKIFLPLFYVVYFTKSALHPSNLHTVSPILFVLHIDFWLSFFMVAVSLPNLG